MTDSYRTHATPASTAEPQNMTFASAMYPRWKTKIYNLNIQTRVINPIWVGSATNPIWSPDGRYLLYTIGYEKTNLFLWDNSLGKSDLLYTGSFIDNDKPAWAADGRSIVFSAFTTGSESGLFQLPIAE